MDSFVHSVSQSVIQLHPKLRTSSPPFSSRTAASPAHYSFARGPHPSNHSRVRAVDVLQTLHAPDALRELDKRDTLDVLHEVDKRDAPHYASRGRARHPVDVLSWQGVEGFA